MQGSSPVTERAFHFEDSYILLAKEELKINSLQTPKVQFSVLMRGAGVFPLSQSVLANKETTDSMHSDQGSKMHFGFLQGCPVRTNQELIAYFREDKGSSLESEAELQSGELCSVK
ncbi:hypothetical protein PROFUN_08766 [Planoprotostelium fungivorum]|uniref:Uncharacterized protein n=1 Tax=Planoprotostelium fungivorum TaxID=1890364 RepID=A0A2P6MVN3_9EUKA|nr:hypothetical protein PROFUN_08766 [Planoprotostelium fungivorum]